MAGYGVPEFHAEVISQVAKLARTEFQNEGIDESVLQDMLALWQHKLAPADATAGIEELGEFYGDEYYNEFNFAAQSAASLPLQLARPEQAAPANVDDYGKPKAFMPNPASKGKGPGGAGGASSASSSRGGYQPSNYGQYDGAADSPADDAVEAQALRPLQRRSRPSPSTSVVPVQDEASLSAASSVATAAQHATSVAPADVTLRSVMSRPRRTPRVGGQWDGQSDGSDNDEGGKGDDGDESLHSDLDDPNDEEEDAETSDQILCMYEKVTRIRNKWRFVLKDGIMHIDGRDYLFQRATGELEW